MSSALAAPNPWQTVYDSWGEPKAATSWRERARPNQLPPPSWKRTWYVRGGRGSGKTWTASNAFAEVIRKHWSTPGEWGVIAPTYGDAKTVCIESQNSGLILAMGGKAGPGGTLLEKGPLLERWNRSTGELTLANGGIIFVDGADDGALRVQGKNLRGCWCDEIGLWKQWKTAWEESIRFAVRLSPGRIIASGTPKADRSARKLVKALIDDPNVPVTLLKTRDNLANLDAGTVEELLALEGTRLGRQELDGELLEDVVGALWTLEMIETDRITGIAPMAMLDDMLRCVVGVDPTGTNTAGSDECGIVVAGKGHDGRGYVLADRTTSASPAGWAKRAVAAYHEFKADKIVAETNFGGDMVVETIHNIDAGVRVEKRTASRGKRVRAEPISTLYEQHLVSHVGYFPELEEQQTTWLPDSGESPDRMDAAVWAIDALGIVSRSFEPVAPVEMPQENQWDLGPSSADLGWDMGGYSDYGR